jgi:hypothetical protein
MHGYVRSCRTAAALVGLLLLLGACTTAQEVPLSGGTAPTSLTAGDDVTIVTKDGRKLSFTVEQVEADAILGAHTRVPVAEIARVEVERVSPAKTAIVVIATPLVLVISTMVTISAFLVIALAL